MLHHAQMRFSSRRILRARRARSCRTSSSCAAQDARCSRHVRRSIRLPSRQRSCSPVPDCVGISTGGLPTRSRGL